MKWPFVRRSKYDLLDKKNDSLLEEFKKCLNEVTRLNQELANELNSHRETKECFEYTIDGLRIHNNNLEKEIQKTKEALNETKQSHLATDQLVNILKNEISTLQGLSEKLEFDLEETKAHEQKLFEAHDKLNQQNIGLLFEAEQWKKTLDCWMGKSATTKSEILKVRGYLKTIAKKL